jgi:hypothetical protein
MPFASARPRRAPACPRGLLRARRPRPVFRDRGGGSCSRALNWLVSIDPILALPGAREAGRRTVVAVSLIAGGRAVKGPSIA